ncbi:polysaccharide deacetylase, partial [Pseudomonas syringae pv. tagetis]
LEEMRRDKFDMLYREHEHALITMTIQPDLYGRPHVILMMERFIVHIHIHACVKFVTLDEISDELVLRTTSNR